MLSVRNPDLFYGYGGRRRVARRRPRRHGAGFFSSLGNAFSKAHDFIKSNKLVSGIANGLGSVGVPYASAIGSAADALGYGRRRRRVVRRRPAGMGRRRVGRPRVPRRRGGFNLRGALSAAHGLVKKHQLASKALSALGHPKLASAASSLGYGRRRRAAPRRRRGMGFFSNVGSLLSKANDFAKKTGVVSKGLAALGHPNASGIAQSLGYGRRRAPRRRVMAHSHRHRGAGSLFGSITQVAAPKY